MFMLLLKTQIVQLNQLFMVLPETTSVLIIIFKQHILPYNCNQNQKRGEKEWGLGGRGGGVILKKEVKGHIFGTLLSPLEHHIVRRVIVTFPNLPVK